MKTLDKIIGKIERFIENLYIQGIYECTQRKIKFSEEGYKTNKSTYQKN